MARFVDILVYIGNMTARQIGIRLPGLPGAHEIA